MRTLQDVLTHRIAHGVLIVGLVATPALRVLCSGTCEPVPDADVHASAGIEEAPECHEHPEVSDETAPSAPEPLDDDCRHSGETSSYSRLAAALKGAADGSKALVAVLPVAPGRLTALPTPTLSTRAAHPLPDTRLVVVPPPLRR